MSNRGRQNVASYFAKDLLLDWRIGAAYFEAMLLDYDVQQLRKLDVCIGVGNDPRDRKFNVRMQAERYGRKRKVSTCGTKKVCLNEITINSRGPTQYSASLV